MPEDRFAVTHRPGPIDRFVLADRQARSFAEVAPGRGGMATRFAVGGVEVLALDEATLLDPSRNVRGGIPVLFPSPGRLAGDRYAGNGAMRQHGFARDLPWEVVDRATDGAAALTVALASSDETRARFPFDFRLALTYRLSGPSLRLELACENRSAAPLPLHAGFHPYFAIPDGEKPRATVETRATRAFDNVTRADVALPGPIDLARPEVDLHLHDHGGPSSALSWPGRRIAVTASADFRHFVVWTLAGRDFVCVEPWTAPADALHTGDRLIHVAPGDTWRGFVEAALA